MNKNNFAWHSECLIPPYMISATISSFGFPPLESHQILHSTAYQITELLTWKREHFRDNTDTKSSYATAVTSLHNFSFIFWELLVSLFWKSTDTSFRRTLRRLKAMSKSNSALEIATSQAVLKTDLTK